MKKIEDIYVYVNEDNKNNEEGICVSIINNQFFYPMISTGRTQLILDKMREDAKKFSKEKNKPVKLLKFTNPEIIEIIDETSGSN